MQYNYPDWSEKDAKAGRYTVGSKVAYKSSDGIERIFQANEGYAGGISPPDNDDTWNFVEDVIYDWKAEMKYKIGSVVRYNGLQYIATKRYRGGSSPPSDELDPDGIRTWMLNYEDGAEPVTPFFYRKKFGYINNEEAYPFANFLEGIDYLSIPIFLPDSEGNFESSTPENDRFYHQRVDNSILEFPSNLDRRPEQGLVNSVMEAHPYHDIYVTGENRYLGPQGSQKEVFEWFNNAKHKSEIRDKFWGDYVTYKKNTNFFTPKRNIPYWGSYFAYQLDASSFSNLTNGVSIEYYPDEPSSNFELISKEYTRNFTVLDQWYISGGYGGPASVSMITPIAVASFGASISVSPVNGETSGDPNLTIFVKPLNICVDSVSITFYFGLTKTYCWVSGFTQSGQPIIECSEPEISYFQQTYKYNENTRDASDDFTDAFKSKRYKLIPNPDYDPDCVPVYDEQGNSSCPQEFLKVEDTDYPDTSIDMSSYLQFGNNQEGSGGESKVTLIGWSIS